MVRMEHDALVMQIIGWLTGRPDVDLPDPLRLADELTRTLSRQRRYEEAHSLQEACEHLLNVRRSYETLAEARRLRFATMWPLTASAELPSVRLNLVWNGKLREPVSLYPRTLEEVLGKALDPLRHQQGSSAGGVAPPALVAVPQRELDSFLAIRRWFYDAEHTPRVMLPEPEADPALWQALKARLAAEAQRMWSTGPARVGEDRFS
jgi:hypothetical protein